MDITFSWSGADVTKNYLGCTWTNGETKEAYATTYTLDHASYTTTYLYIRDTQSWDRVATGDQLKIKARHRYSQSAFGGTTDVDLISERVDLLGILSAGVYRYRESQNGVFFASTSSTILTNGTISPLASQLDGSGGALGASKSGSVTSNVGGENLTITWSANF
jgi:hypothetical protein